MDFGLDIPSYNRVLPDGYRHCNKCHNDLPESEFGFNPVLKAPFTYCRSCFAQEAKTLAYRLEWYVHNGAPSNLPEDMGTDSYSIEDWLVAMAETAEGTKVARYARNMRTPEEEAKRLLDTGQVKDSLEFDEDSAEKENDPYAGYKERLREWQSHKKKMGL